MIESNSPWKAIAFLKKFCRREVDLFDALPILSLFLDQATNELLSEYRTDVLFHRSCLLVSVRLWAKDFVNRNTLPEIEEQWPEILEEQKRKSSDFSTLRMFNSLVGVLQKSSIEEDRELARALKCAKKENEEGARRLGKLFLFILDAYILTDFGTVDDASLDESLNGESVSRSELDCLIHPQATSVVALLLRE